MKHSNDIKKGLWASRNSWEQKTAGLFPPQWEAILLEQLAPHNKTTASRITLILIFQAVLCTGFSEVSFAALGSMQPRVTCTSARPNSIVKLTPQRCFAPHCSVNTFGACQLNQHFGIQWTTLPRCPRGFHHGVVLSGLITAHTQVHSSLGDTRTLQNVLCARKKNNTTVQQHLVGTNSFG